MARKRRTLKRYQELYRNPYSLFPAGPNSEGVKTTIFPNGENEIWFQANDGLGIRVTAGNGPAGLGIRVQRFIAGNPLTVTDDGLTGEVSVCQYRQDDRSQAFKRWYLHQETEADLEILGADYRRKA